MVNLYYLARFQMETGFPSLMFFNLNATKVVTHHGPQDMENLMSFINEQTGRGPAPKKVYFKLIY